MWFIFNMSIMFVINKSATLNKRLVFLCILFTFIVCFLGVLKVQNYKQERMLPKSIPTVRMNRVEISSESLFLINKQLHQKLEEIRLLTMSEIKNTKVQIKRPLGYIVLYAGKDNYWDKIARIPDIRTVYSKLDQKNWFPGKLYNWGVSEEMCAVNHSSIPPDCKHHVTPDRALEIQGNSTTSSLSATIFLHIVKKGSVNSNGYVAVGDSFIIPTGCLETQNKNNIQQQTRQHHREVFVISQFWGGGYFHANIENIPRLALYIPFLRKFDHIQIHVASKARYIVDNLNALGIVKDRLITGVTKADIVYLPQGTGCGDVHQPSGYLLSSYYHHYIETNLLKISSIGRSVITNMTKYSPKQKPHDNSPSDPSLLEKQLNCSQSMNLIDQLNHLATKHKDKQYGSRCTETHGTSASRSSSVSNKTVILIKRSEKRWLVQHDEIALRLKNMSKRTHLDFVEFSDVKLPSFNETLLMFYNAVLIVAPHGAGLSNMIYSRPETYIIEVLCKNEPNFCFRGLAQKQGMHYYGIPSTTNCGPMKVDMTSLMLAVELYIDKILKEKQMKFDTHVVIS